MPEFCCVPKTIAQVPAEKTGVFELAVISDEFCSSGTCDPRLLNPGTSTTSWLRPSSSIISGTIRSSVRAFSLPPQSIARNPVSVINSITILFASSSWLQTNTSSD